VEIQPTWTPILRATAEPPIVCDPVAPDNRSLPAATAWLPTRTQRDGIDQASDDDPPKDSDRLALTAELRS
jgi:hypothetical protein